MDLLIFCVLRPQLFEESCFMCSLCKVPGLLRSIPDKNKQKMNDTLSFKNEWQTLLTWKSKRSKHSWSPSNLFANGREKKEIESKSLGQENTITSDYLGIQLGRTHLVVVL